MEDDQFEHAPGSLFYLPLELRNMIYKILYQKIDIYCSRQPGSPEEATFFCTAAGPCAGCRKPGISLLLASRQAYREAKPYFDRAPITVSGHLDPNNGPHVGCQIPRHVLPRITELTVHGTPHMYNTSVNRRAFNLSFLNASLCPHLKTIWLKIPRGQDTLIHNRWELPYFEIGRGSPLLRVVCLLPFPNNQIAVPGLHLLAPPSIIRWAKSTFPFPMTRNPMDNDLTRLAIQRADWTIKVPFRLVIMGIDTHDIRRLSSDNSKKVIKLLFRESFDIVVVRDRHGVRIGNPPNFSGKPWWDNPTGWRQFATSREGRHRFEVKIGGDSLRWYGEYMLWWAVEWEAEAL